MADGMECDLAIAGGGLAGGLLALALATRRPDLDVVLVEAGEHIGGSRIWSFFESDVEPGHRWLVDPLVTASWPGYILAFPTLRRAVRMPCHAILSERLDAALRARMPPSHILCGRKALAVGRTGITLEDGSRIEAKAVIDARGPATLALLDTGWRKYLGQVVRTARPHGLDRPVLIDATVRQIDGFRFVRLLPLGPDRLLIEDTYYSDGANLDRHLIARRIADYAELRGWEIAGIEREETGVLPITMGGDFERYWQSGGSGVAKAGARAGLFHPTTGDSLADAVRTAILVAEMAHPATPELHPALHEHARRSWEGRGFYRLLSRLLFRAVPAGRRYRVMQRFHALPARRLARFHAACSTRGDRLRLLAGKPRWPLLRALSLLRERKA